jgi:hypothetical protein
VAVIGGGQAGCLVVDWAVTAIIAVEIVAGVRFHHSSFHLSARALVRPDRRRHDAPKMSPQMTGAQNFMRN